MTPSFYFLGLFSFYIFALAFPPLVRGNSYPAVIHVLSNCTDPICQAIEGDVLFVNFTSVEQLEHDLSLAKEELANTTADIAAAELLLNETKSYLEEASIDLSSAEAELTDASAELDDLLQRLTIAEQQFDLIANVTAELETPATASTTASTTTLSTTVPGGPNSGSSSSGSGGDVLLIVIVVIIVIVIVVLLIVALVYRQRQQRKIASSLRNELSELENEMILMNSVCMRAKHILQTKYQRLLLDRGVNFATIEIERSRIAICEELGSGKYGRVFKANIAPVGTSASSAWSNSQTPSQAAVKVVHAQSSAEEQANLLIESYLMSVMRHPCITELVGVCMKPFMLVMEYMAYGNLRDYLRSSNNALVADSHKPDVYVLTAFITQICSAMRFLEENKVVHRDLAARNVLIGADLKVKLSDFGLSRSLDNKEYYRKLTEEEIPVRWISIETLEDHVYSSKSDVWSFGIVMWETMSFGETPYSALTNFEVVSFVQSGRRLQKPAMCPLNLYDLMLLCWSADPGQRPPFSRLGPQLDTMLAATPRTTQTNDYYARYSTNGGTQPSHPSNVLHLTPSNLAPHTRPQVQLLDGSRTSQARLILDTSGDDDQEEECQL